MTPGELSGSAPPDPGDRATATTATPATPAEAVPRRGGRGRLVLAGVVAAVVVVVAVFSAGWLAAPRVPTPSDGSVEAGFARDMQTHHNQAVEMSLILRDVTDDAEVRSLAYDIATSQSQQSGQMYAWLNMWGLSQASTRPVMSWMLQPTLDGSDSGHGHGGAQATADPLMDDAASTPASEPMVPGDPMPGMATFEQLNELQRLRGVEAERLYLQLMIAHHRGGVEMAEAAVARTTNPLVVTLANAIIVAQQSEIDYMQSLLDARS
ncbi:DUF305 domain-containing protein [Herbiconiux sp. CPCC 203407]|uniref:DUF305 domain-containing protein n=1 Tax=Herbiconiux oxytropis TaxID=2970915 RepID=A0AA41XF59_9MICO|nr:DUF305 domain-containing protein [Herbiconiux oxytropis]MCS5722296.1 DUF305 domain-containing protein [Herbiconiux oxytropis]MCS5727066.1 DUF305 domain-containing protein [Herbiconiux oxytropis]